MDSVDHIICPERAGRDRAVSAASTEPNHSAGCGTGSIGVEQAIADLLQETDPVSGVEWVPLPDAVARVLADPAAAPRPVPAHTNSAVDGYAVRGIDLADRGRRVPFRVVGTALAGKPFSGCIGPREAIRVMTGAVMPEGLDTVIMQEQAVLVGDMVRVDDRQRPGQNVRAAGEDLRQGDTVLRSGRWLTPADVGLLASMGLGGVRVRRRLQVAVLSTGSEVRGLGEALPAGAVYDSNRYILLAALQRMGMSVHDLGIVADDPLELTARLREASGYSDVVISSGGVSIGEADYVRPALSRAGRIRFWKVAMKPGHPLAFGKIGDAAFFGLPGNPVAVLVSFYWLVRPALEKLMGISERPLIPLVPAKAATPFHKRPGRMEFHRAVLEPHADGHYRISSVGDQGSGILRSMSVANSLAVLAEASGPVMPGDPVSALPFSAIF